MFVGHLVEVSSSLVTTIVLRLKVSFLNVALRSRIQAELLDIYLFLVYNDNVKITLNIMTPNTAKNLNPDEGIVFPRTSNEAKKSTPGQVFEVLQGGLSEPEQPFKNLKDSELEKAFSEAKVEHPLEGLKDSEVNTAIDKAEAGELVTEVASKYPFQGLQDSEIKAVISNMTENELLAAMELPGIKKAPDITDAIEPVYRIDKVDNLIKLAKRAYPDVPPEIVEQGIIDSVIKERVARFEARQAREKTRTVLTGTKAA
jgi:hypothetical protein